MNKLNKTLKLVIKNGVITAIYDDALTALFSDAVEIEIKRASHVEPSVAWPGDWTADMRPVGGPILGGFHTRQAALDAEVEYLKEHVVV